LQLDVATSGRGGMAPFIGICIIAAAFGVADGHVQGGMTGDLSLMCPEFIQVPFRENFVSLEDSRNTVWFLTCSVAYWLICFIISPSLLD
jgi:hypothetical protein